MRQIPLSRELVNALKTWRLRSPYSRSDDLVFPNRRGGYTCHSNFVKRGFKLLASQGQRRHRQLARAAALRDQHLDRGRALAEDGADVRRAQLA